MIGAGLHVFPRAPPLPIVSLTVLTCRRGLALNGIFDIDALYLVLDTRRPLLAQMAAPTVLDPFAGYVAWQARRPRIVHWEEVERCHARHGLRIARTLAACGQHELDAALVDAYRMRRPAGPVDAPDEVFSDLLKLLAGPQWGAGLRLARQLGGFTGIRTFAWLATALARWESTEVSTDEWRGPDTVVARAQRWLAALGDGAQEPLAPLAAAIPSVFAFT